MFLSILGNAIKGIRKVVYTYNSGLTWKSQSSENDAGKTFN